MTISPNSDLACLAEGTRFLARRPGAALGLAGLGMALAALAPLIQMRAGLPNDLTVSSAVLGAVILPLELYFMPRFLMEADAAAGGNPLNIVSEWQARFEERWLRAFIAKVLLGTAAFLGVLSLLLPGLIVLLAFGWVPMRVLLKGETLLQAAKGSLRMMATSWRRTLLGGLFLALIYLTLEMLMGFLVGLVVPEPTLRQRMVHPILWLSNFIASFLSLWLGACFLALFRRLDPSPVPAPPDEAPPE